MVSISRQGLDKPVCLQFIRCTKDLTFHRNRGSRLNAFRNVGLLMMYPARAYGKSLQVWRTQCSRSAAHCGRVTWNLKRALYRLLFSLNGALFWFHVSSTESMQNPLETVMVEPWEEQGLPRPSSCWRQKARGIEPQRSIAIGGGGLN